jgi:hypothetical protein
MAGAAASEGGRLGRLVQGLLVALSVCACLPAHVRAAPSVSMHVALTPGRLGRPTAVDIDVQIATPPVPPPLSALAILYPGELGFTNSELGLESCAQSQLEVHGPAGCPADSRMGDGSARAQAPFASGTVSETGRLQIVRGPQQAGHTQLLFYVEDSQPLSAQLAFSSLLLPASAPYEQIQIDVPLIHSIPEAPDIALVALHATLDPSGLTYYETRRGRRVAYHPKGVILPHRCPRGGFAFGAVLSFVGGAHAKVRTEVPCRAPRARARESERTSEDAVGHRGLDQTRRRPLGGRGPAHRESVP